MTILAWLFATFVFWFAFATLMRVRDKLEDAKAGSLSYRVILVVGYPLFVVGFIYDVLYNLTYGTLVFAQFPRKWEWTFTARLQRLVHDKRTWRGKVARFICLYLVEPWDKDHCGEGRRV